MSIGSEFREAIDEIDEAIIDLIAERYDQVAGIQIWKKENNIPSRDFNREQDIRDKYIEAFGEEDGTRIANALLGVV
jgi:chorismate mutase